MKKDNPRQVPKNPKPGLLLNPVDYSPLDDNGKWPQCDKEPFNPMACFSTIEGQ